MAQEPQQKFTWINTTVSINSVVASDCNTIVFWNQGTSVVQIDMGMTLNPPDTATKKEGVAYCFGGERLEFQDGSFQIMFLPPQGQINRLIVSRKIYHE